MTLALMILCLAGLYVLIGLVFGLAFVFRAVDQIDPGAHGASVLVRLLWLPGSVALWPVLLLKWSSRRSH